MRASCSFLSSRDAFKCQQGCASRDLLHYFCCYPCTGSSRVQKSCLQQVSIQILPVLGEGLSPHSCHHPQETPWDQLSALPRVSGMGLLYFSHGKPEQSDTEAPRQESPSSRVLHPPPPHPSPGAQGLPGCRRLRWQDINK